MTIKVNTYYSYYSTGDAEKSKKRVKRVMHLYMHVFNTSEAYHNNS